MSKPKAPPPTDAVSVVEAMVRRVTGVVDFRASLEKGPGERWKLCHNKEAELNLYYVYVSGAAAEDNNKASTLLLDNVFYLAREDLPFDPTVGEQTWKT